MICDGIAIVASLLPSLHASYKTGEVKGEGHTGMDATFQFSLPKHILEFTALVISSLTGLDLDIVGPHFPTRGSVSKCFSLTSPFHVFQFVLNESFSLLYNIETSASQRISF